MNQKFDQLEAVTLFCRQCGQAMPVRKCLLLVTLDYELYEYLCAACGTSLGQKKEPLAPPPVRLS